MISLGEYDRWAVGWPQVYKKNTKKAIQCKTRLSKILVYYICFKQGAGTIALWSEVKFLNVNLTYKAACDLYVMSMVTLVEQWCVLFQLPSRTETWLPAPPSPPTPAPQPTSSFLVSSPQPQPAPSGRESTPSFPYTSRGKISHTSVKAKGDCGDISVIEVPLTFVLIAVNVKRGCRSDDIFECFSYYLVVCPSLSLMFVCCLMLFSTIFLLYDEDL